MSHLQSAVEVLEIGRMDEHLGVKYMLKHDDIGWYYECNMKKYVDKTISAYEESRSECKASEPDAT